MLATIDGRDKSGLSPLWVAVNRGDERAIALLTNSGATFGDTPPIETREFEPPTHRPAVASVSTGRRESKSSTGKSSSPPTEGEGALAQSLTLFRAATEGDIDVLLSLAALGETMDATDPFGKTPLRLVRRVAKKKNYINE